ncbi:hypothetical protein HK104_008876 [Borealophlyctis nickersoniae]|nr:hypothetical protein HK104_008876 [Borealophlyctis nickersoniae]
MRLVDPDCCDGTDEYDGRVKCPNTCKEIGAKYREEQLEAHRIQKEGARLKEEYISFAQQAKAGRIGEVDRLEAEVEEVSKRYDAVRSRLDEAETQERETREAQAVDAEKCETRVTGVRGWLDKILGAVSGLKKSKCSEAVLEKVVDTYEEIVKEQGKEQEEVAARPSLAELEESQELRTELNEISSEKSRKETELADLRKKEETDFGPDREYEKLLDQCVEWDSPEYTYEICFFGRSTQKSKTGGGDTGLGSWTRWSGHPNLYSEMKFENGLRCWTGPERSMTVTLECGTKEEVVSVAEPQKCEYVARVRTPAACDLKVLEKGSDAKAGGEGVMHDEL